ncbi:MAG: hypothetical protein C5B49_15710 [Bdellovibrio sp.]|nr:MAG: hypothetical protein C5B49_15710 [Bdellovibrio sp.]
MGSEALGKLSLHRSHDRNDRDGPYWMIEFGVLNYYTVVPVIIVALVAILEANFMEILMVVTLVVTKMVKIIMIVSTDDLGFPPGSRSIKTHHMGIVVSRKRQPETIVKAGIIPLVGDEQTILKDHRPIRAAYEVSVIGFSQKDFFTGDKTGPVDGTWCSPTPSHRLSAIHKGIKRILVQLIRCWLVMENSRSHPET